MIPKVGSQTTIYTQKPVSFKGGLIDADTLDQIKSLTSNVDGLTNENNEKTMKKVKKLLIFSAAFIGTVVALKRYDARTKNMIIEAGKKVAKHTGKALRNIKSNDLTGINKFKKAIFEKINKFATELTTKKHTLKGKVIPEQYGVNLLKPFNNEKIQEALTSTMEKLNNSNSAMSKIQSALNGIKYFAGACVGMYSASKMSEE